MINFGKYNSIPVSLFRTNKTQTKSKLGKKYPKKGRKKYGVRATKPQITTQSRAASNAGGKIVEGHDKFGKCLEQLGFKEVGGEIFESKYTRIVLLDESGNDKAKARRKTFHLSWQSNRKIERKHLPHITMVPAVTLAGTSLPTLLITKHAKYMNPQILQRVHDIDPNALFSSSKSGYINSTILEALILKYLALGLHQH